MHIFMTNFISWNCGSFTNKRDEIRAIIFDRQSIYFALHETRFKKNDKVPIRGYNIFRKDFHSSERVNGGVAILIANDFPHKPVPLNTIF